MDIFVENMVLKKKEAKDIIKIVAVVICALIFTVVGGYVSAITSSVVFSIWFFGVIAAWYGVHVFIAKQNIEYEYNLTNGELDFDVIYSKRKRRHLLTVRVKEFLVCAPVYDEQYSAMFYDAKGIKKRYDMASSLHSRNIYFADFMLNAEKVRIIFEPSEKMIQSIRLYNPRNVYLAEREN